MSNQLIKDVADWCNANNISLPASEKLCKIMEGYVANNAGVLKANVALVEERDALMAEVRRLGFPPVTEMPNIYAYTVRTSVINATVKQWDAIYQLMDQGPGAGHGLLHNNPSIFLEKVGLVGIAAEANTDERDYYDELCALHREQAHELP